MAFTVTADFRVKVKESEKKDKYLDLAWELKTVAGIQIVIGALSIVTKELVHGLEDLEIRGRVQSIQTTALLRMARILRRVLDTEEICNHSHSSKKPLANAGVKNSNNDTNDNVTTTEV